MTVYLVGAGPGDPGLLTVRGAQVLAAADVVLFDRLVSRELLALAPKDALLVDVGKRPGRAGASRQAEINALLVEHGRSHSTVVRLKGGDPYVFGRGGEEAEALLSAGVAFEVVPGVSSAFSVPAMAGVPVTHRGLSRAVTVVTAHVQEVSGDSSSDTVDWEALAQAAGTLVVMMGMRDREEIASRLIRAGRRGSTPVLVVQDGTTAAQRVERCTLETLPEVKLEAPSIIVIGEVASLDLAPRLGLELEGLEVVVTRAIDQSEELVDALTLAGARAVSLPVVKISEPPDGTRQVSEALERLSRGVYEWALFTSVNAVKRLLQPAGGPACLRNVRVGVVGARTARELAGHGLRADLVPDSSNARALAEQVPDPRPTDSSGAPRVLFVRGEQAEAVLPEILRSRGWQVDEAVVYATVAAAAEDGLTEEALLQASRADAVTFASPSAVRFYLSAAAGHRIPPVVACIGPSTARAARSEGLEVDVEADEQSARGLVRALCRHFSGLARPGRA